VYGGLRKFLEDRDQISRRKHSRQMIPLFRRPLLAQHLPRRSLAGDFVCQLRRMFSCSCQNSFYDSSDRRHEFEPMYSGLLFLPFLYRLLSILFSQDLLFFFGKR
jgi:hypothetical protein